MPQPHRSETSRPLERHPVLASEHSQSYRGGGRGGDDHGGGGGAGAGGDGGVLGPMKHCWAIAAAWHAERR